MKPQASSTDVQATSAATQAVGVRRAGLSAFAIPSRFIRPLRTAALDDSRPLPNEAATPSRFRTPPRTLPVSPPRFSKPRRFQPSRRALASISTQEEHMTGNAQRALRPSRNDGLRAKLATALPTQGTRAPKVHTPRPRPARGGHLRPNPHDRPSLRRRPGNPRNDHRDPGRHGRGTHRPPEPQRLGHPRQLPVLLRPVSHRMHPGHPRPGLPGTRDGPRFSPPWRARRPSRSPSSARVLAGLPDVCPAKAVLSARRAYQDKTGTGTCLWLGWRPGTGMIRKEILADEIHV